MAKELSEREKAAAKRRQAEEGFTPEERNEQLLAAYGEERRGYVQRAATGDQTVKAAMKLRISDVDKAIRELGGKPSADADSDKA